MLRRTKHRASIWLLTNPTADLAAAVVARTLTEARELAAAADETDSWLDPELVDVVVVGVAVWPEPRVLAVGLRPGTWARLKNGGTS